MKHGVCVGALDLQSGRNLRLLTAQGYQQLPNTALEIGDEWLIDWQVLTSDLEPPHVEDVCVVDAMFLEKDPTLLPRSGASRVWRS